MSFCGKVLLSAKVSLRAKVSLLAKVTQCFSDPCQVKMSSLNFSIKNISNIVYLLNQN